MQCRVTAHGRTCSSDPRIHARRLMGSVRALCLVAVLSASAMADELYVDATNGWSIMLPAGVPPKEPEPMAYGPGWHFGFGSEQWAGATNVESHFVVQRIDDRNVSPKAWVDEYLAFTKTVAEHEHGGVVEESEPRNVVLPSGMRGYEAWQTWTDVRQAKPREGINVYFISQRGSEGIWSVTLTRIANAGTLLPSKDAALALMRTCVQSFVVLDTRSPEGRSTSAKK